MNDQERIEYFMSEIARLSNQVFDLQNERDALAAQVERLTPLARRCIWGALVWNDHNFGDLRGCLKEETYKAGILDIDEANGFLAATPQQHLAEIRAEVGRAGFVAGIDALETAQILGSDFDAEKSANEYVAKVRQGGSE